MLLRPSFMPWLQLMSVGPVSSCLTKSPSRGLDSRRNLDRLRSGAGDCVSDTVTQEMIRVRVWIKLELTLFSIVRTLKEDAGAVAETGAATYPRRRNCAIFLASVRMN